MRAGLISIGILACVTRVFAQGTVNFAEAADALIHVYASNPGSPEITGDASNDVPPGPVSYAGLPLIGGSSNSASAFGWGYGNQFTVQLFGAVGSGLPFTQLSPLTQYTTTFSIKPSGAGEFIGCSPDSDPGIPGTGLSPSARATLAFAVWDNDG